MIYTHKYHQLLTCKLFLAEKPGIVHINFEDSLDIIKKISNITLGIKQIVYLTGWQFDGHDSKYPSWSEVNQRLRRKRDSTARESMLWIMRESANFNAVVSVHINMDDAYENSPLWETYRKNDLLMKNIDGSITKGGIWGGEQST